jgi:hypothetical protein
LLSRRFVLVLGRDHEVIILHHLLLGDAFAVLANCSAPAESMHGDMLSQRLNATYWRLAYAHYTRVFRRVNWSPPNVQFYSTSFGLARTLHELGHTESALSLLLTALSDSLGDPTISKSCSASQKTQAFDAAVKADGGGDLPYRYLSRDTTAVGSDFRLPTESTPDLYMAQASCFWLAAILLVESLPENVMEGWYRALACLRSSSELYQRALQGIPVHEDHISRAFCLTKLRTVEEEAKRLLSLRGEGVAPSSARSSYTYRPSSVFESPRERRLHRHIS